MARSFSTSQVFRQKAKDFSSSFAFATFHSSRADSTLVRSRSSVSLRHCSFSSFTILSNERSWLAFNAPSARRCSSWFIWTTQATTQQPHNNRTTTEQQQNNNSSQVRMMVCRLPSPTTVHPPRTFSRKASSAADPSNASLKALSALAASPSDASNCNCTAPSSF